MIDDDWNYGGVQSSGMNWSSESNDDVAGGAAGAIRDEDVLAVRGILSVDDERRILEPVGDCLTHSYIVETATNLRVTLSSIQRQRADIVLLDVMLQGASASIS